jgi:hypothetical protein
MLKVMDAVDAGTSEPPKQPGEQIAKPIVALSRSAFVGFELKLIALPNSVISGAVKSCCQIPPGTMLL